MNRVRLGEVVGYHMAISDRTLTFTFVELLNAPKLKSFAFPRFLLSVPASYLA